MRNIYILIFALFITAYNETSESSDTNQVTNEQIDEFVSGFDGKSLDEINKEFKLSIKQIESFLDLFDGSISSDIESFKKEDEQYEPVFAIDTTHIEQALKQFKNIQFEQTFQYAESEVQFAFKNPEIRRPMELGQGVIQRFKPQKIYYHNGTTELNNVSNYEVDFAFSQNWGKALPMDSVAIDFEVEYLTDYDVVEVSSTNPVATYKGGEVKLVMSKNNYAYITLSDSISDYMAVQGLNSEGKYLDNKGSSNNSIAPEDSDAIMSDMLDAIKKVQKKLDNNDFETTEEFKAFVAKNLKNLKFFNDIDGVYHVEKYYYGNVNAIKVYFNKSSSKRQSSFVATNINPLNSEGLLLQMPTDNGIAFINANGETQITVKTGAESLNPIGGDFYEDQQYFYVLNRDKQRLDSLLVYDIRSFGNGLIGILEEEQYDDYILYSNDNKRLGTYTYFDLTQVDDLVFGLRDNQYYLLDANGKETLVPGVTKIYSKNSSSNRILVSNNQNYGFLDANGNIVLPLKYKNATDFEADVAAVNINGTIKFIDLNGHIILDTKQEGSPSVYDKDENDNRIYSFDYGRVKYDYKGNLISNN